MASANSWCRGTMLPVGPEKPSDSASLMAWRSMARLAAIRMRRAAPGGPPGPWAGDLGRRTAVVGLGARGRPGGGAPALGMGPVQEVGDVHLAALERGRPRGFVRDAPQHEPLHGRRLAPVTVEGFEDELDAGLEAHELVGPGPDGRLPVPVLTHLLEVLLRYD